MLLFKQSDFYRRFYRRRMMDVRVKIKIAHRPAHGALKLGNKM